MRARAPLLLLLPLIALAHTAARGADVAADAPPPPTAKLQGPSGTAVAFSADGRCILTADADAARVWDARTFQPVGGVMRPGEREDLLVAAFSPDARTVLTASGRDVRLWDVATGRQLSVLAHPAAVRSATFSPDGSQLLSGADDGIARLWGLPGGARLKEFAHPQFNGIPVRAVCIVAFRPSAGREELLTVEIAMHVDDIDGTSWNGLGYLWNARSGKRLRELHVAYHSESAARHRHRVAAFSPDGNRLAVVAHGNAFVSDAHSDDEPPGIGAGQEIGVTSSVAFSPDGRRLVRCGGKRSYAVEVVDATTGKTLREWLFERVPEEAVFSPNGERILVATPGPSPAIDIVNANGGAPVLHLTGQPNDHTAPVFAFSPDGRRVVVAFAADGWTGVYDVPAGPGTKP